MPDATAIALDLFTQAMKHQGEPWYAEMLRQLRLRLDAELARVYAPTASPGHRLNAIMWKEGS